MELLFQYSGTTILYCLIVVVSVLLAYLANKQNKYYKLFLTILFLFLLFFLAFRGSTVGTDTKNYLQMIQWMKSGHFSFVYGDIGFKFLLLILCKFSVWNQFPLIIIALLTIGFVLGRLWELKGQYSFTLMLFIYVTVFYWQSFNYSRQWLACAILFWGTRYLFQNRQNVFLAIVISCIFIHASSVIVLLVFGIYLVFGKLGKISVKNLLLLLVAIFSGVIFIIRSSRAEYLLEKYISTNIGISSFFTILIILLIEVLSHSKQFGLKTTSENNDGIIGIEYVEKRTYTLTYIVGVLVAMIFTGTEYASRVAIYLLIFEMPYFSYLGDNAEIKLIKRCAVILLCLKVFYSMLCSGGYGIMPYSFCSLL